MRTVHSDSGIMRERGASESFSFASLQPEYNNIDIFPSTTVTSLRSLHSIDYLLIGMSSLGRRENEGAAPDSAVKRDEEKSQEKKEARMDTYRSPGLVWGG